MKLIARLNAFQGGAVREIDVPDSEAAGLNTPDLLELAFKYGQNDFQPVAGRSSVSAGDEIELNDGRRYRVATIGFDRVDT